MARVSREQAHLNRERVVEVASRLFRERGYQGIGIADLMAEAGLTHGGFYNNFASKDALAGEACAYAFGDTDFDLAVSAGKREPGSLGTMVDAYLSPSHRARPGTGCPLPALAADAAREPLGSPLRHSFTAGLTAMVERVAAVLPAATKARRRKRALGSIATLVGAVALARAVDDDDLAEEILEAARAAAIQG
jgi:TetR/AcrR family transcriptional regulator, transcriptional repressor for nem operon